MVFISEGVLPKALGTRKALQGGTAVSWLKLGQSLMSESFKVTSKKNLNIWGEQLVLDKEDTRAQISNKTKLPLKESPINQEPVTLRQNCQQ